jgi:hypothetical protein
MLGSVAINGLSMCLAKGMECNRRGEAWGKGFGEEPKAANDAPHGAVRGRVLESPACVSSFC